MKTYPYPNGRTQPRNVRSQHKKLILFILFILLAILSFAQSGNGVFSRAYVIKLIPQHESAVQQIVKTK